MRGINRNIMECKLLITVIFLILISSINRNIMECKYDIGDTWNQENGVLIETLWNVKSGEGLGNSERAEWLFLGIYGN